MRKSSPTSRGSSCKRKYGATTPPRGAKLGKRGFRLLYIFTSPGSLQPVTKKATTSDWASSSRPITSPPRNYEDYISSTSARATRSTTSILKTLKIDERCAKGVPIQDPKMSAAKKGLHTMFDLDWAPLYGREIDEAPPHGGAFTMSQVKRAPTQPRGGVNTNM